MPPSYWIDKARCKSWLEKFERPFTDWLHGDRIHRMVAAGSSRRDTKSSRDLCR